jgi:hypothetical protein
VVDRHDLRRRERRAARDGLQRLNRVLDDDPSLLEVLVGDGRPLLVAVGASLIFSGGFALFVSAAGLLLPHDVAYLGMTTAELCAIAGCRVVRFMVHDRVAWGGSLAAVGVLYLWLAAFPLARGEPWAWWTLVVTGITGYASFLLYLGYGYLDTWHGFGSLVLLPVYVAGLARSRGLLRGDPGPRALLRPGAGPPWRSRAGLGRLLLLGVAAGLLVGGTVVSAIGATGVFVPQDLDYIGLSAADLDAINPRLVSLMAHDRAGFGGAVATTGLAALCCLWCASPSRSLRHVLALSGTLGFGTAVGIHWIVGYDDVLHLT